MRAKISDLRRETCDLGSTPATRVLSVYERRMRAGRVGGFRIALSWWLRHHTRPTSADDAAESAINEQFRGERR